MKLKFLGAVSLLILISGLYLFSDNTDRPTTLGSTPTIPCKEPLTYRFDDLDSRFNITKKELADIMKEVENLWAKALDRDLLNYHKDGKVAIQLIYSEEQKRMEDERQFSKRIELKAEEIKVKKQEYQHLAEQYKKMEKEFENKVSKYNQLTESYNNLAQKGSDQNLSEDQLAKLKETERQIKSLESVINRMQRDLESLRKRTNSKSEKLNKLVEEQNEMITTYNNRFGDATKFDQGQYVKQGKSESIKIFQFANKAELKTVLAHEAGHALGLQHVNNSKSIMYHMMGKQNIFNLKLTDEDIAAIKERCKK